MKAGRGMLGELCFAAEGLSGTAAASSLRKLGSIMDTAPSGRLFGAITVGDVVSAVEAAGGPSVDKRKVTIVSPIKALGSHKVEVRVHPEVLATVTVDVVSA